MFVWYYFEIMIRPTLKLTLWTLPLIENKSKNSLIKTSVCEVDVKRFFFISQNKLTVCFSLNIYFFDKT